MSILLTLENLVSCKFCISRSTSSTGLWCILFRTNHDVFAIIFRGHILQGVEEMTVGPCHHISDCLVIEIAILSLAHSMRSETRNDNIIIVMAHEILLCPFWCHIRLFSGNKILLPPNRWFKLPYHGQVFAAYYSFLSDAYSWPLQSTLRKNVPCGQVSSGRFTTYDQRISCYFSMIMK